jgi:hypothetical protein
MKRNRKPIEWVKTESGCFECISHTLSHNGYPLIKRNGKQQRLSRYLYEVLFGEIPKGLLVCHKCDNPRCINPEHWFLGTPKDNTQDMIKKGRNFKVRTNRPDLYIDNRGEKSGNAKLTDNDIRNIRADNRTVRDIAKSYGVHNSVISRIKTFKSWKHVL